MEGLDEHVLRHQILDLSFCNQVRHHLHDVVGADGLALLVKLE
jgi:hypothetical protein